MPFLFIRTASALTAGFLLTGPSAPASTRASSDTGTVGTAAPCPAPRWTAAHWAGNQYQYRSSQAQPPAGLNSQITSVAALSPTDVWMLITRTDQHKNNVSDVYHLVGTERRDPVNLDDIEKSFVAKWIVARSDTDVWVIGSARRTLEAWHYNGSRWSDHPPTSYSYAVIDAAALGSDGILYLAGYNGHTHAGVILSYDGARWADLSPASPPDGYKALAVTPGGTLIAAGGGRHGGILQEKSGPRWTTVSLSAPVGTITRVSVAPGGTVYGVGSTAGNEPVLIKQRPGSRSANVIDAPAVEQDTAAANKTDMATIGLDVWLLGEDEPHDGWHHSWITHDNSGFAAAIRRMSKVANRLSSTAPRSGQPCWPGTTSRNEIAIRTIPGGSRCDWARREGSRLPWLHRTRTTPDRSHGAAAVPMIISPRQAPRAARSRAPTQGSSAVRQAQAADPVPSPGPAEQQALSTPSPASAPADHGSGANRFSCHVQTLGG
jgi:hypothetical protein